MANTIIQIQNLSFSFENHSVLRDVNLEVVEGDFMAVIGPNGGGKTTMLKLILGLLKPDRGEILYSDGNDSPDSMTLGYVPQNTNINLKFPVTVMDVTLMGCLKKSSRAWGYSRENRHRAREALEMVGMLEYSRHRMGELSGGQRQRVLFARALAAKPKVLFLDEPTSSLDSEWHARIYDLLHDINDTTTIVVATHDISILSTYVKSVACVKETVFHHHGSEFTKEMMDQLYQCPVELIAHGLPHRVLQDHDH